jgi:hypothetical protein
MLGTIFLFAQRWCKSRQNAGCGGVFLFGSRQSGALKPVPFCTAFGRLAVNREKWKKMKSATLVHA